MESSKLVIRYTIFESVLPEILELIEKYWEVDGTKFKYTLKLLSTEYGVQSDTIHKLVFSYSSAEIYRGTCGKCQIEVWQELYSSRSEYNKPFNTLCATHLEEYNEEWKRRDPYFIQQEAERRQKEENSRTQKLKEAFDAKRWLHLSANNMQLLWKIASFKKSSLIEMVLGDLPSAFHEVYQKELELFEAMGLMVVEPAEKDEEEVTYRVHPNIEAELLKHIQSLPSPLSAVQK
ncbi:MAG: hypothetical protein ACKVOR_12740 [Flavobacteriales bacterium]